VSETRRRPCASTLRTSPPLRGSIARDEILRKWETSSRRMGPLRASPPLRGSIAIFKKKKRRETLR
jgi:hypothetical protein